MANPPPNHTLPPNIPVGDGQATVVDALGYLKQAVAVLGDVNLDQLTLTEAGKVAYAQALATISLAATSRRLSDALEDLDRPSQIRRVLSDRTGRD
jgi:hypothetical protein